MRSRCDGKKTGCQPKVLVVDLGGFTADMPGWVPDMSACDSLENGVILLYNRVRAKADELDALMSKAREQTPGAGSIPLP